MFGTLVFSACLALALAHQNNTPNPNSQDQCPPDQSHYLLPHEWDCTKFYYCEYGTRWEEPRDCAPGTEFSYDLQVCVHPALANCTLANVPPTEGTTTTTTHKPTTTSTTTTHKPTTTSTTTTHKPTTTSTTTTTTHKPTTTSTTTTTTTPKPTTTSTTTTTTTPKPTTTSTTTTTTTHKPTTTSTTTTTTPKPTTTSTPTTHKPTTTSTTTHKPTTTTQEPTTDCPKCGLLPNGCPEDSNVFLLLSNEHDCSKFYYCNFGEKVEYDCPDGTLFNAEQQVCDWPQNVKCSAATEAPTTEGSGWNPEDGRLPNGCPKDHTVFQLLPNKEDCSKFWYCNFGDLAEDNCPEGTLFNAEIQVCDWPWNVNCEAGSGDGSSTENYPSHPSNSTSTEGPYNSTTERPTHPTTHGPYNSTTERPTHPTTQGPYNSTTERPTHPTTHGPYNSTTERPTHPTTQGPYNSTTERPTHPTTQGPYNSTTEGPNNSSTGKPTTEDGSEGETLPNGCPADWSVFQLLPHEKHCNKFYYCNFGELVDTTCPERTVFNPEISVCDWPENVDCGSKGIDNGQETTENPNVHPNGCPKDHSVSQLLPNEEYCNKFYYCIFGDLVEKVCPDNLVFNPELQVCDWPYNVNCGDKETDNGNGNSNDDRCKNNCNIAPWAAHKSNSFWRCEGDVAVKVTCSQGLKFNTESGTCDYAPAL